ncbi:MAG: XdhC family protein [Cyanobacteria bacterium P01_A01_bin.84]
MKELQDIIAAVDILEETGEQAALATLVKVSGSTYRSPGARMLIQNDGNSIGAISGGCLEGDVLEKAQTVIQSSTPIVVKYDTTSEDDMIWGLGLGCQGVAYILIEPLELHQLQILKFIQSCIANRNHDAIAPSFPLAIATVISVEDKIKGENKTQVGESLLLSGDTFINNLSINNLRNHHLLEKVVSDSQIALQKRYSTIKEYQLLTEKIEVFIEIIQPPLSLIIFGAGYDVLPLINFAKQLGWDVTVVDNRQRENSKTRFLQADKIHLSSPEDVLENIKITEMSFGVVMSHNYLDDLEMLKQLLPLSLNYLGILGPRKRTNRLLQELQEEGIVPSSNIYSPVGLEIGADNAEEIALSIVAEIQAVYSQHQQV